MTVSIQKNMPEADYHAAKALSASGAWTLASECPALYWAFSPLNPASLPQDDANGPMDVGTALHLAVLEPKQLAKRAVVVDVENWRTKEARQRREEARMYGQVALLAKDRDLIDELAHALWGNSFVRDMLDGADTEVSYFWDSRGVACKARADIIAKDGRRIGDLKASKSAAPEFFQHRAFNAGHFLRSVWYAAGWEVASGNRADYHYIVVSTDPPHLVTVAKLDDRATAWGEQMVGRALTLFRECRKRNVWPPYCPEPVTLSLPSWSEFRLADDEQAGSFDADQIAAAIRLFAPQGKTNA